MFGDKFWQGQPTPPRLGVMAGLLQVHKVVVNSVVGEDEIMERNILNVVKGQIFQLLLGWLNDKYLLRLQ